MFNSNKLRQFEDLINNPKWHTIPVLSPMIILLSVSNVNLSCRDLQNLFLFKITRPGIPATKSQLHSSKQKNVKIDL